MRPFRWPQRAWDGTHPPDAAALVGGASSMHICTGGASRVHACMQLVHAHQPQTGGTVYCDVAVVAADAHVSANSNHCTYALSIYVRASMCTASAGVTVSVTVSASVGVRVRARVSMCERVCVCELYVLPTLCWRGWIMASVVLNSLACLS